MSLRPPQYCRYRGSYARVKINGKWVHLGPYDAPESKAEYKRLIAQWSAGLSPDSDDNDTITLAEVLIQYLEQKEADRRTPASCGNRAKPQRRARALAKVSEGYDVPEYRRAITRAYERAGVQPWTPHRLRHTTREVFGLDGVQAALGHSHVRVSEIYAALATEKAVEIARKLG